MPATTRPLFEQIDSWLQDIDQTKTASASPAPSKPNTKKAATKKAGPSGMGKSTHPSDDVDNNTQDEETGARYEENSQDVKKDVPGQAVDETDPKSGGDQDDKQYNIGTNQSATGEDASVEDDYKSDKDDPGTEHPADAESVGEKYSSMSLGQLLKTAEEKAHNLLADLANGIDQPATAKTVPQKAAAAKAAAPTQPTSPKVEAPAAKTAATAGYDASTLAVETEKVAADFVAQTIQDAVDDADLVGAFIHSYEQRRAKLAADEAGEGEDHSEGKEKEDGGGAPPTDDGSGAGAGAAPVPTGGGGGGDVLSALGGAGGGGAPGGDMGGLGGGAPAPAGPGGPGGPGGGMSQEQALQELAMALQELGISPEELAQMAQQGGGGAPGAGGGMPPGAGGPPGGGMPPGAGGGLPPMPPPDAAAEGAKLASAVKRFKLAGKFKVEEAKTAAQRQARDQIKSYIRELTGTNY